MKRALIALGLALGLVFGLTSPADAVPYDEVDRQADIVRIDWEDVVDHGLPDVPSSMEINVLLGRSTYVSQQEATDRCNSINGLAAAWEQKFRPNRADTPIWVCYRAGEMPPGTSIVAVSEVRHARIHADRFHNTTVPVAHDYTVVVMRGISEYVDARNQCWSYFSSGRHVELEVKYNGVNWQGANFTCVRDWGQM